MLIPAGIVDQGQLVVTIGILSACLWLHVNRTASLAIAIGLLIHAVNQNELQIGALYLVTDFATGVIVVLFAQRDRPQHLVLWNAIVVAHIAIMAGLLSVFWGGAAIKLMALLSTVLLLPGGGVRERLDHRGLDRGWRPGGAIRLSRSRSDGGLEDDH